MLYVFYMYYVVIIINFVSVKVDIDQWVFNMEMRLFGIKNAKYLNNLASFMQISSCFLGWRLRCIYALVWVLVDLTIFCF